MILRLTLQQGQLGSVQLLDKRSQSDPNSAISTIIAPLDSSLAMIDFELITLTNHADAVAQEWDTSAYILCTLVLVLPLVYSLFFLTPQTSCIEEDEVCTCCGFCLITQALLAIPISSSGIINHTIYYITPSNRFEYVVLPFDPPLN